MIVVDIETSGTNFLKCGIWKIGAIDFENPEQVFLEEARIDDGDKIVNMPENKKTVFEVIGKTEAQLRDKKKQSQKQLLERFFKWCEKSKAKNIMCQNPQFDLAFLQIKAQKYDLKSPIHYRAFDLHSIAQARYLQLKGKFLLEEGRSDMGLTNILKLCGMKDERKVHNALEDAKLTAECFSRILKGKNLLKEYKKFKIPKYLKQK